MPTYRSWADAQRALGLTDAQVRAHRLTPRNAPILPPLASPAEETLWQLIDATWPGEAVREYQFSETARYRFDVAFVADWLGIECDGWQFHGKRKADFARDRTKDRLATLEGWRVLRFTAREIVQESTMVVEVITRVRSICSRPTVSEHNEAAS